MRMPIGGRGVAYQLVTLMMQQQASYSSCDTLWSVTAHEACLLGTNIGIRLP